MGRVNRVPENANFIIFFREGAMEENIQFYNFFREGVPGPLSSYLQIFSAFISVLLSALR